LDIQRGREVIVDSSRPGKKTTVYENRLVFPMSFYVFIIAVALLVTSGVLYRVAADYLGVITKKPIRLSISLSTYPYEFGDWKGKDIAISETVLRIAQNDDYLCRVYTNRKTNEHVNVYVAYTARPRTMIGHKPNICYQASGWVHDSTEKRSVVLPSGRTVPCLLHRFRRPAPNSEEVVVLNYYIVNGQLTTDEDIFSGVGWRTPNISGNPARYVAQVQLASVSEESVRMAARDMADILMPFFPAGSDQSGTTLVTDMEHGRQKVK
jgi:EpsI family protein